MRPLFDPQMFNYTWESIDHDRQVVGTYYIEDVIEDSDFIDHFAQVQRLALEGSTSSWQEVTEDTQELRERLSSKVLGYFEIPAPKGTKKAIIQLGYPVGNWEVPVNVPMLLLSIAGNYSAFSTKMRMLDLYIPEKVAGEFQGPKFGVAGIRNILGVYGRPLVLHIIKPKFDTRNRYRREFGLLGKFGFAHEKRFAHGFEIVYGHRSSEKVWVSEHNTYNDDDDGLIDWFYFYA